MSRIEDAVAAINAATPYEGMYIFPRVPGKRRIYVTHAIVMLRSGRITPDDVMHNLEISRQVVAVHEARRIEIAKLLDTLRPILPANAKATPCRPKLQVVR